jgi:hypothetical protein
VCASPSLPTVGHLDQLKAFLAEFSGSGGGGGLAVGQVEAVARLREWLSELPDPRVRQGLRHSLVSACQLRLGLARAINAGIKFPSW